MTENRVNIVSSNTDNLLCGVLYPGKVKNHDRAIETLGGLSKISNTFTSERTRLELKFHPGSVYNKPAFGDVQKATGLLLRVKRGITNTSGSCDVEVLGCVEKIVKFKSLCDHQYLPLQKNEKTKEIEYVYDKIVPNKIPDSDWVMKDQPIFLPPGVFARDNIQSNAFRGDQVQDCPDENLGIALNRKRPAAYIPFTLTEPIPSAPNKAAAKLMAVKFVTDEQFTLVKELFEQCPIWPKCALLYETEINENKLKYILPCVGYYFTTGPWRTMWIRYGFDPRTEFTCRYYQTFDFRLRQALGVNDYVKIRRIVQLRQNRIKALPSSKCGTEALYPYYDEGTFPRARQCLFRYIDVRFPKIQAMLKDMPTPLPGTICDEKRGWISPGVDEEIRQILSKSIVELFRKTKFEENQQEEYENDISDEDDDEDDEQDDDQGQDADVDAADWIEGELENMLATDIKMDMSQD